MSTLGMPPTEMLRGRWMGERRMEPLGPVRNGRSVETFLRECEASLHRQGGYDINRVMHLITSWQTAFQVQFHTKEFPNTNLIPAQAGCSQPTALRRAPEKCCITRPDPAYAFRNQRSARVALFLSLTTCYQRTQVAQSLQGVEPEGSAQTQQAGGD
jgi:hypothetical protein